MFGQAAFWIDLPLPNGTSIYADPEDPHSDFTPELNEAADKILSFLRECGWHPTAWSIGYLDIDDDEEYFLAALFWAAFPIPGHDDICLDLDDDAEPQLIPELESTGAYITSKLNQMGWNPTGWDIGYFEDRPPSHAMSLEPPPHD